MNRSILGAFIGALAFFAAGCTGQKNLDDIAIVLSIGMDLDPSGKIVVYEASPVFHSEAKEKTEILRTKGRSLRQSRGKLNDLATGPVLGGKTQNYLIGKKMIKKKHLFPYLDVEYRDPKNSMNANLVIVDGSVEQIMNKKFPDKPRLSVYIKKLVDDAANSQRTLKITLQQFHRLHYEKGITPYCSELALKDRNIAVMGTALLDKKGIYATSLDTTESSLLLMLQNKATSSISLSTRVPPETFKDQKTEGTISLLVDYQDYKVISSFKNNQFQFDIQIKLSIVVTESTLSIDFDKDQKKLETLLAKQIQKESETIIKEIQQHKIDPIGLGLHARAYQYDQWTKVENDWGRALSKATITFTPTVQILGYGTVK